MPFSQLEPWLIKVVAILPKLIFAIAGGLLSLMLSGDIGRDGTIRITRLVVLKLSVSVIISITGGAAFIEQYRLQDHSELALGFVYLTFAVFGMLVIGIIYQSIAMMRGKTLAEIISEIKDAFFAIFGR